MSTLGVTKDQTASPYVSKPALPQSEISFCQSDTVRNGSIGEWNCGCIAHEGQTITAATRHRPTLTVCGGVAVKKVGNDKQSLGNRNRRSRDPSRTRRR